MRACRSATRARTSASSPIAPTALPAGGSSRRCPFPWPPAPSAPRPPPPTRPKSRRREARLRVHGNERVERGIQFLDSIQKELCQLHARDLFLRERGGKFLERGVQHP